MTRLIGVELHQLVRSRRTWVTILLIDLLPTIVAVLLAVTDIGPRPGSGPAFLSAVLTDGTLFPLAAMAIVLPLFLPIAVAVQAGDAIAGEAQQGTLRYLLVRPVGRTRLLLAKLVSVMAFVLLTLAIVAATAYVVGVLLLGNGDIGQTTTVSGTALSQQQLIGRDVPGAGLRAAVHARCGRDRTVPLDRRREPARGGHGHHGGARGLDAAAHARRGGLDRVVPAHALLAGLRRPVPRPDPLARRRTRLAAAGRLRAGVPRRRLGRTSPRRI